MPKPSSPTSVVSQHPVSGQLTPDQHTSQIDTSDQHTPDQHTSKWEVNTDLTDPDTEKATNKIQAGFGDKEAGSDLKSVQVDVD